MEKEQFKISLPAGFKAVKSAGEAAAFVGPGDRWLHIGRIRFAQKSPVSKPSERLLRVLGKRVGPAPFLDSMKRIAHDVLAGNAEPGTLDILREESAEVAGRPALLVISHYRRERDVRSHLYCTMAPSGESVIVGFTAPTGDDMAWTKPILEGLQLLVTRPIEVEAEPGPEV